MVGYEIPYITTWERHEQDAKIHNIGTKLRWINHFYDDANRLLKVPLLSKLPTTVGPTFFSARLHINGLRVRTEDGKIPTCQGVTS